MRKEKIEYIEFDDFVNTTGVKAYLRLYYIKEDEDSLNIKKV